VKKDFVLPIVVLTLICIVVTGALAMMNNVTAPIIQQAAEERAFQAMSNKIPQATGFVPVEHDGLPRAIRAAYRTENDVGYVFIVSVNGFSGEIRVMSGVDNDGRIISSSTLHHTETQGIGTILDQDSFTSQFDGKDINLEGIAAVTGATISTVAYIEAVRYALEAMELIRGGQ